MKTKPRKKKCLLEDCASQRQNKGYCSKHYRWIVKGVTPREKKEQSVRVPRKKEKTECCVNGCERMSTTKDMCGMHYRRVRRHGDPGVNYARKYRSNLISVDNVLRPHMNGFTTADEREAVREMFQESSDRYY